MYIDCHIIRNLAPSSLNRDDTGAPKSTIFGGVRRAAISSQALKRAMRLYMQEKNCIPPEEQAIRTKRLIAQTADILAARGRDPETAIRAAELALAGVGLKSDEKHQTEYMLFMPGNAPELLAEVLDAHFDDVVTAIDRIGAESAGEGSDGQKGSKAKKDLRRVVCNHMPGEVIKRVEQLLDHKTIVQAAFGRMLADLKQYNIDAFVSVARAIGTNRLVAEFDYVSVVDDLLNDDESGAGFLGLDEYNSACMYEFMTISVRQALKNLDGDRARVRMAVEGLLNAFAYAIPSGKKNAFPSFVNPSLMLVVVQEDQPLQLCNAFDTPIYPTEEKGLIQRSIETLDEYFGETVAKWNRMESIRYIGAVKEGRAQLRVLAAYEKSSIKTLIEEAIAAMG